MKVTPSAASQRAAIEARIDAALFQVKHEALRAMMKHGPMHSSHEAFGVIFEEFNVEFVAEMVANNHDKQRTEMVQVGAMAVRALVDVYNVGK